MSRWLGLEDKAQGSPETKISLKQSGLGLRFKRNCHTTEWVLINEE